MTFQMAQENAEALQIPARPGEVKGRKSLIARFSLPYRSNDNYLNDAANGLEAGLQRFGRVNNIIEPVAQIGVIG
jgi:hypothetical protein